MLRHGQSCYGIHELWENHSFNAFLRLSKNIYHILSIAIISPDLI